MRNSIRTFLLVYILLSITLVLVAATLIDIVTERAALRKYLDNQLKLVALSIEKFVTGEDMKKSALFIPKEVKGGRASQSSSIQVLQYQIWDTKDKGWVLKPVNFKNKLLAYSEEGFSDKWINNERWRVYSMLDTQKNIKLILAERYNFRKSLEFQIVWDSLFIFLAVYPLLGLLIWWIMSRGFSTFNRMANALSHRGSSALEPFYFHKVPIEIKPLIDQLNGLFARLKAVFEREKRFAADAAHELRTPLAIIRAQSQVALTAKNGLGREEALKKLITGVDRSSHVVDQLLILSRMESQDFYAAFNLVDLVRQAREVIALLAPLAVKKEIEIEFKTEVSTALIQGIPTAIDILIRNLVDNAIRYTHEGGTVQVVVMQSEEGVILKVIDNGPGVPPELRERVFERFYRVLDGEAKGTGLGLGIVQQIIRIHQATITLDAPKTGKGLEITVCFHAYKT